MIPENLDIFVGFLALGLALGLAMTCLYGLGLMITTFIAWLCGNDS